MAHSLVLRDTRQYASSALYGQHLRTKSPIRDRDIVYKICQLVNRECFLAILMSG